ncbi:hypothetical protein HYX02_04530 [Candidatus Woesearchaeota archaeon]|nr:hypothetical protein [Candidatus Woesearchaeota archaeon]
MNGDSDIIKNLEYVANAFEEIFGKRLLFIAQVDARRKAVSDIINNDAIFMEKDPNFVLIRMIEETNRQSQNFLTFLRNLRAKRAQIQQLESELSTFVLEQLQRTEEGFGGEDSFDIFWRLYGVIAKNPDKNYIEGFLITPPHPFEFQKALSKLKGGKFARELRKLIEGLTNQESLYLTRYLAEVSNWHNREINTEEVPFFVSKTNSFLYGGGMYLGIYSYFKDKALLSYILKSHAILHLMRYQQELALLEKLKEDVISYHTDADWAKSTSRFMQFYNRINKIADTFASRFGNPATAAKFLENKERFGEWPEKWLEFIESELSEISAPNYRRTQIIQPFVLELERIFGLRLSELRATKKPRLEELKTKLEELIRARTESENVSARSITQASENFKKEFGKRSRNLRRKFEILSNNCIDKMMDFVNAKYNLIERRIRLEIYRRLRNAHAAVKSEKKFVQHSLNTIGQDFEGNLLNPNRFIALLYDFHKLAIITSIASESLRSIGVVLSRRDVLRRIGTLNNYLLAAEKAYTQMDNFILTELGFLVENQEPNVRREEYGRATTRS